MSGSGSSIEGEKKVPLRKYVLPLRTGCALGQNNTEISHTSVLEMFRWETSPVVILYVAVSVFLPALPAKVLAAQDDHTRMFPEL